MPEILHKLEIIEIQLKLLFESYRSFLNRFLIWELRPSLKKDNETKRLLIKDFRQIVHSLSQYCKDVKLYISHTNKIIKKVDATKSPSMIKSMEHNLYKVDEVLIRCNTYIYLMDESQTHVVDTLCDPEPKHSKTTPVNRKRFLN
ncbi:MAG: hypothetical protein LBF00_02335 [Mycoplasmataceae bacterium]|nr:hypothetical protein [Mycoplasmataceae bacterium]